MAAVGFEVLGAGVQGAGEVEAGDRTAGALAVAVAECDHDGGAVVAVHDPDGDDPDHAGVPAVVAEHDRALAIRIQPEIGHLRDRLLQDLPLHRLPLAVLRFQIGRDLGGPSFVGDGEHLDREPRVAHPPAGVEPRREQEADVETVEALAGQAGGGDQRLHADELALPCRPLRPKCGQDAVLADERHDVGDRPQRRQRRGFDQELAELVRHPLRAAHRQPDPPRQLERHASPAEVRVGVALVARSGQAGMDDGEAVGEKR